MRQISGWRSTLSFGLESMARNPLRTRVGYDQIGQKSLRPTGFARSVEIGVPEIARAPVGLGRYALFV